MTRLIFFLSILTGLHCLSGSAQTLSLAGEWRFDIAGANTEKCPEELRQKIHLPGTMDDAGLGPKNTKPPTLEGPWRLHDSPAQRGINATSRFPPRGRGNE